MHVFTTVKGVTKTDILSAVILDENGTKQNKKYTPYLAFTALENGC